MFHKVFQILGLILQNPEEPSPRLPHTLPFTAFRSAGEMFSSRAQKLHHHQDELSLSQSTGAARP